jgi:hypothetical protein
LSSITGGRTWLAGLLIVPMLAGFLIFDAGVGMIIGVATAATLIVVAARMTADGPIEVAEPGPGVAGGLFVLAVDPIDDVRTAGVVAAVADPSREEVAGGVLVVAPARSSVLARWTDDLERGRFESQRALAVSIATLAAAGVEAEGRVGDGDTLRAAEDALRSYAAAEVVVIAAEGRDEREIAELERRLDRPLRRLFPVI